MGQGNPKNAPVGKDCMSQRGFQRSFANEHRVETKSCNKERSGENRLYTFQGITHSQLAVR